MAWIKSKINGSVVSTDQTDVLAGGVFLVATVAAMAVLYTIGM
jgi:hypothetical protein